MNYVRLERNSPTRNLFDTVWSQLHRNCRSGYARSNALNSNKTCNVWEHKEHFVRNSMLHKALGKCWKYSNQTEKLKLQMFNSVWHVFDFYLLHPYCCKLFHNVTKWNRIICSVFFCKIYKVEFLMCLASFRLRKNLFVHSVIQEKLKEKESRKTQTFKKDDDKKKKLMQAEVQVGLAFVTVMCVKFVHGSGVVALMFSMSCCTMQSGFL